MRAFRPRRPSPALVVASLALIVALGGTSYAAFTLPRNIGSGGGTAGASTDGATVFFFVTGTGAYAQGDWAVTSP